MVTRKQLWEQLTAHGIDICYEWYRSSGRYREIYWITPPGGKTTLLERAIESGLVNALLTKGPN